ncbi:hypothetical protein ACFQ3N_10100 [Virgibacillus byunsanensis]|uniref:YtxH domain-containing protein n=1 Tax=Virgibacillus byunsanensis TaxID=570945 RepID=A0ABW3LK38_9BACI
MKKRCALSVVGAMGASVASVAGYFLTKQENREKVKEKAKSFTKRMKRNDTHSTLEDAGIPDQTGNKDPAQLENAKMVSEGSQFGVEYYNEVKAENNEDSFKK